MVQGIYRLRSLGDGRLVLAAGCASQMNERVRDFNDEGVNMFAKGDYRAAQESFEAALPLTPQDPPLLYNLGQCHDRLGDWRQAENYYLACLRADPKHD